MRIYWREYSVALDYKTPICANLNEQDAQQGAEAYRFIFTLSALL